MNEHTHKQFDTEMEAIRSGVLAMGGLVESQLRRAIALLEADDHDAIIQRRFFCRAEQSQHLAGVRSQNQRSRR